MRLAARGAISSAIGILRPLAGGYDRIQYESLTDLTREVRRLVIQQIGPLAKRKGD